MNPRTGIRLLLVTLALIGLAWWQWKREASATALVDVPLFLANDPAAVRSIRIENLEHDIHMRFARGEDGRWRMSDPIPVAADEGLIAFLLSSALARRGSAVPPEEHDAHKLGFDPPRVILEIGAESGGQISSEKIEIGALDPDQTRVNVRVRGALVRTVRDLDDVLARPLDDFKTHQVFELDLASIVHVERSGRSAGEGHGPPQDMAFSAELVEGAWRVNEPIQAALDPAAFSVWLQGAARLQIQSYVDQHQTPLASYGLDPPELRIQLQDARGEHEAVRLGRGPLNRGAYAAAREGLPFVWAIEQNSGYLLATPLEQLVDPHLGHLPRGGVDSILLRGPARELSFTRDGHEWRVAEKRAGEPNFDKPLWAERARVEELLGQIEKTEFVGFLRGESVPSTDEAPAILVRAGGSTIGGWFGAAAKALDGTECVRFLRVGDSLAALAPKALRELVDGTLDLYASRKLAEVIEHDQQALVLRGFKTEVRYTRGKQGRWSRQGGSDEAKELRSVLDPLCFLRAARRLAPIVEPMWDEPIEVEFTSSVGVPLKIRLGKSPGAAPGESVELIVDGQHAVAAQQSLHEKLALILRGG